VAQQEAARIGQEAQAMSVSIAEQSGRQARAARDEAAREVLAQVRAETQAAARAATVQAGEVRRLARVRMPGLVAQAVELARAGPMSVTRAAPDPGPEAGRRA